MAKRPSKKSARSQAHKRYVAKVRKLQSAGYLKNVDPRKKPTPSVFAAFTKHRDILSGRAQALQAPTNAKAKELRKRLGVKGSGKTVIIPREKGERIHITKGGVVKSRRERYGQTIEKEIGAKIKPPEAGEKFYYTLPYRRRGLTGLHRHTFASFDEMLFYLTKYEIDFDEIEDYIEVEKVREGGRKDKQLRNKYVRERKAAYKSYKRKYAKRRRRRKARR